MHVFVTGATGWVGAAVVEDLLAAGHQVTGLARSADKAASLSATGAKVVHGTLDDLDTLRSAASKADAVIPLEQGVTVSVYHAVADEEVPFKAVADVIGSRLGLPVESRGSDHFGWFANMAGSDMSASSARTRELLGWKPQGPSLLVDLDQPGYYAG